MPKMPFWLLAKAYSAPGPGAIAVNFSLKLSRFRGLKMLHNQEANEKAINTGKYTKILRERSKVW